MDDFRCVNCDSRYCGSTCDADRPDFGYVPGFGYRHIDLCWDLYQQGFSVDWPQTPVWATLHTLGRSAWTPVRDTLASPLR